MYHSSSAGQPNPVMNATMSMSVVKTQNRSCWSPSVRFPPAASESCIRFGMSFLAVAAEHPLAASAAARSAEAAGFIAECRAMGTSEVAIEQGEKKGFDTGFTVKHPFTGEEYPVWIANFVLMEYGTGAIFGCPAHDQRDLDFARKYDLPVRRVVAEGDNEDLEFEGDVAYTGPGRIVNSHWLNGMTVDDGKAAVIAKAQHEGWGEGQTQYRLRDWGVSRQR
jgi:leucyl-tRNA synthetase